MECGTFFQSPEQRPLGKSNPLIFLAGPIQGAPNWQIRTKELIWGIGKDMESAYYIDIASPRRHYFERSSGNREAEMYREQVEWEREYLKQAGQGGVILFWLAKEVQHNCERAYAQTTRFELGEACVLHKYEDYRVVVGIEEGFTNARYLRKTISEKYPSIPILNTLEETCNAAVEHVLAR